MEKERRAVDKIKITWLDDAGTQLIQYEQTVVAEMAGHALSAAIEAVKIVLVADRKRGLDKFSRFL